MSSSSSKYDFIRCLRRDRFGIGQSGPNPLASMLQEAIKLLSAELYQKDIHFISELLQNAEDNSYDESVIPSIEIFLTRSDITRTGAPATLVLFNNEVGFSEKNIESLCGAGQSTKKGKKSQGYIGEKGIGFKSVFLVSKRPHVISNGFRIRFNEEPDNEAKLGYIVPEWTEEPTDSALRSVYGGTTLPTTAIVLPLRQEKIEEVSTQLTQIPVETLLFLSKICKLAISDQRSSPKNVILSRSNEFKSSKNSTLETSTVFLSSQVGQSDEIVSNYYMFKQVFQVPEEAKVEKRKDVDRWVITLAFPVDDRISSSRNIGDVFSFLPSDVHSGLPFLINADFLLVSSRETLLFDSPWNQGIFRCIPDAYCAAFDLLLNSSAFGLKDIPSVARLAMYRHVPVNSCRNSYLERVRQEILSKLTQSNVILCSSDIGRPQPRNLCRPAYARKINNLFRSVLEDAPSCPPFLRNQSYSIVDKYLQSNHSHVLRTLNVTEMSDDDYYRSLDNEEWIKSLDERTYVKLLGFVKVQGSSLWHLSFLKYLNSSGELMLASMADLDCKAGRCVYWDSGSSSTSWLAKWTRMFRKWLTFDFIPSAFAAEVRKDFNLKCWLENTPFEVTELHASSFAAQVLQAASAKLLVLSMHFLFDLHQRDRNSYRSLKGNVMKDLRILADTGAVCNRDHGPLLLPAASGAKWPLLLRSRVWSDSVVKMSDDYMESTVIALGDSDVREQFLKFLAERFSATDIPSMAPLDKHLPSHYAGKSEASLLLLDWIPTYDLAQCHFIPSIRQCEWLKTSHGYRRPTESFYPSTELLEMLKTDDVPFIDVNWIPVKKYEAKFRILGVAVERGMGYKTVLQSLYNLQEINPEQVETDKVLRLYQYLCRCLEESLTKDVSLIWIPRRENHPPAWKKKAECVIHDVEGLFEEIGIAALEKCKCYDARMLRAFQDKLGVDLTPSTEKFCILWQTWSVKGDDIDVRKCAIVWHQFVASSLSKRSPYWRTFVRESSVPAIPACQSHSAIVKLLPPAKTVIADDLELEHIFANSSLCPSVAWYPARQEIELRKLYEIYMSMGVKKMSECTVSRTDSASLSLGLGRKLVWEDRYINQGLLKAVLGYLALSLTTEERQTIALKLLHVQEVELETPLEVHWTLTIGGVTSNAVSNRMLDWNNERQELAYVAKEQRQERNTEFGMEFARMIAQKLLADHRDLIQGLEKHLSLLVFSKFDVREVENTLIKQNMRLYAEDEEFLTTGLVVSKSKALVEKKLVDKTEVEGMEPFSVNLPVPTTIPCDEAQVDGNPDEYEPPSTIPLPKVAYHPPRFVIAAGPTPPPPDKRKGLLQEALRVLAALNEFKADAWTMEMPDETFDWYTIARWREQHLPTVRQVLRYPPEEGYLKPGMTTSGTSLDKLLAAAFIVPGIAPDARGASNEHLSIVGAACLNLSLTMELVKMDDPGASAYKNLDKMTNGSLLAACFHASGLGECVLESSTSSASVSDLVAANVMRAILAAGFCAYDNGMEEVRRIYEEVFIAALSSDLDGL